MAIALGDESSGLARTYLKIRISPTKRFVSSSAYFKWTDANLRPQGKEQPQRAAPGTALPPNKTLSGSPPSSSEPK